MKNEKLPFLVLSSFVFFFFLSPFVHAQSEYILSYPSFMPGSKFYKPYLIYEKAARYWYFGDFGRFYYDLKLADKYLVEAKTLSDYRQYLLAYKAIKKSDEFFLNLQPDLIRAKNNKKDIQQKLKLLNSAGQKHLEVFSLLKEIVPGKIVWTPEKSASLEIDFGDVIQKSIEARKKIP